MGVDPTLEGLCEVALSVHPEYFVGLHEFLELIGVRTAEGTVGIENLLLIDVFDKEELHKFATDGLNFDVVFLIDIGLYIEPNFFRDFSDCTFHISLALICLTLCKIQFVQLLTFALNQRILLIHDYR